MERTGIQYQTYVQILRCFASSDRYNKLKSLYSSALADFFYVNTFELFCCLLLRFM